MKVSFHDAAQGEVLEAGRYYREHGGAEVAQRLAQEFERAYGRLLEFPEIGAIWRKATRRLPINRFPYSLVYYLRPDEIRVIAFAHQSRRPGYWRGRR
ncbi:MAG: type II toxin-antitoxin system RelE/ParE family toxin [Burkholderiaceae bacterium]|nr:type II toxin-antitoxin system RelE/ParE family toxin [Burkholderiaceae bacterium]